MGLVVSGPFVVLRPQLPHRPPYLPAGVLFSPSSRLGATLLVIKGGTLFTKLSARCHALALCSYGRASVEQSGLSLWTGVTQCMPHASLWGGKLTVMVVVLSPLVV